MLHQECVVVLDILIHFRFRICGIKKIFKSTHISLFLYQGIDCRSKIVDLDGKRVRLQIW